MAHLEYHQNSAHSALIHIIDVSRQLRILACDYPPGQDSNGDLFPPIYLSPFLPLKKNNIHTYKKICFDDNIEVWLM